MPLEIKELTVHMHVTKNINAKSDAEAARLTRNLRKELVEECFEKVLLYLERKKNR